MSSYSAVKKTGFEECEATSAQDDDSSIPADSDLLGALLLFDA